MDVEFIVINKSYLVGGTLPAAIADELYRRADLGEAVVGEDLHERVAERLDDLGREAPDSPMTVLEAGAQLAGEIRDVLAGRATSPIRVDGDAAEAMWWVLRSSDLIPPQAELYRALETVHRARMERQ
jgi:hypothetical protein